MSEIKLKNSTGHSRAKVAVGRSLSIPGGAYINGIGIDWADGGGHIGADEARAFAHALLVAIGDEEPAAKPARNWADTYVRHTLTGCLYHIIERWQYPGATSWRANYRTRDGVMGEASIYPTASYYEAVEVRTKTVWEVVE